MNFHRLIDGLNGRWISRLEQAPIDSTLADLRALAYVTELPKVEATPAELVWQRENGVSSTDRFSFPSPHPSGITRNDVVSGFRWRGRRTAARSAVIMLHGGFATSFQAEMLFRRPFLARGFDVVVPILPFHMERQPKGSSYSGQFLLSGDAPRLIRGFAQGAADVAALVLALRRVGYEFIVAGGISLGGNVAAQVAVLSDLDGAFLLIPAVDPFVTLWQTPIGAAIRRSADRAGFPAELVERAMRRITPLHLGAPRTAPSRIRLVHCEHDLFCPPGPTRALAEAWGVEDRESLMFGHRTFGFAIPRLRKSLARWGQRLALGSKAT